MLGRSAQLSSTLNGVVLQLQNRTPGVMAWPYVYASLRGTGRSHMPPTGSSGLPWRWRFRPQVHAGRVRHPDAQTDRRAHRRGRAVGTPAGTIRMPPVSRSGSRAADGHQSRIIQRARTRQARARECRGGTGCRSPGRRPMRPPGSPIFLFRYHAERRGGLKRTHADPSLSRGRRLIRSRSPGATDLGRSVWMRPGSSSLTVVMHHR